MRYGLLAIESHWRKMQPPWTGLGGTAAKAALSYALLTSEEEKECAGPARERRRLEPDARQWNMAEGSFDQREAIFAPTPARIAYRVTVPLRAALDFSFTERQRARRRRLHHPCDRRPGRTHEVWSHAVGRHETKKWFDARVDLSAYGGQSVELVLVTETPAQRR